MLVPRHIAIIMDGNGRWAKQHNLPVREGHKAGAESIRRTVDSAIELGVEYVTLYAFSVDNWKRPKDEVDALMNLMRDFLRREEKDIAKKNVRLIVIGRRAQLPKDIVEKIDKLMNSTKNNNKLKLVVALNYGARSEIVDGVRKIIQDAKGGRISAEDINEESFSNYLYTRDIPDPDLFIRTSGEMRLSNFLLWQLSYTELWVTPVLWPDFNKEHMVQAIDEYNSRQRRYGGRV